jgi:hypothetical protein
MTARLWPVGAIAAACGGAQDAYHLWRGEAHDLLWVCNISPFILAAGCFARSSRLVTVAALCLAYGTPLWVLDLVTGGEWIWTSFGPHVVCLVLAWYALRHVGIARMSWLYATLGVLAIFGVTRLLTAPKYNVNLAFSVWAGWEKYFPSYALYFALIVGTFAVSTFTVEKLLPFIGARRA